MPHIIIGAAIFAAGYAVARLLPEGVVEYAKTTGSDIASAGARLANRAGASSAEDAEDAAAEKRNASRTKRKTTKT